MAKFLSYHAYVILRFIVYLVAGTRHRAIVILREVKRAKSVVHIDEERRPILQSEKCMKIFQRAGQAGKVVVVTEGIAGVVPDAFFVVGLAVEGELVLVQVRFNVNWVVDVAPWFLSLCEL